MINNCLNCKTETLNPKFCSKSCSAIYTNKLFPKRKTKRKCIVCGENVISYKHSRCKIHQKEYLETKYDFIEDLTLEHYWNKKSLLLLPKSSKNSHIRLLARSHFKQLTDLPCHNCGYDKHVEICHIKPIRDFLPTDKVGDVNNLNNLIQLCPNCHWEFDNNLLTLVFPEQPKFI